MSREYINRITIKKDGVYISTKSSNVSGGYEVGKIEFFSKAYAEKGQRGLDLVIIPLLFDNIELKGKHPSLDRYYYALNKAKSSDGIYYKCLDKIQEKFNELSKEDAKSVILGGERSEKAKEFLSYRQQEEIKMFRQVADYCIEYDNLVKEKGKEREL